MIHFTFFQGDWKRQEQGKKKKEKKESKKKKKKRRRKESNNNNNKKLEWNRKQKLEKKNSWQHLKRARLYSNLLQAWHRELSATQQMGP